MGPIDILKNGTLSSIGITSKGKVYFPTRGNEPLADYFIKVGEDKYTISAKSGSQTNLLKAKDIIELIEKDPKKKKKWSNTTTFKFCEVVAREPIIRMPFYAVLEVMNKKVLSSAAMKFVDSMSGTPKGMSSTDYDKKLFQPLLKLIGLDKQGTPTLGEIYYYTEKYVVNYINSLGETDKLFDDATTGLVTYVRYSASAKNPVGVFDYMVPNPLEDKKKIAKWRPKNSSKSISDKLGIQP